MLFKTHASELDVHLSAPDFIAFVSSQPKVAAVTQYQSTIARCVVNCRHEQFNLDPLEQELIRLMDGSKSISGLVEPWLAL